ncbi:hypothetical protein FIBSPDRAFT_873667 [Athelia psychrophila]|uniref:Uncharacterized protein n=1 Tax=Athelia psychrophila TaxID=1759441 RepID=A0A165YAB9_9AGAM|nr:hypothetical protein FIBSPDRAFT_873667 [Fibularhizoctonia sp. CBS 109695]
MHPAPTAAPPILPPLTLALPLLSRPPARAIPVINVRVHVLVNVNPLHLHSPLAFPVPFARPGGLVAIPVPAVLSAPAATAASPAVPAVPAALWIRI